MRKNGVLKAVKLTPSRNMSKQKQSKNAGKGTKNAEEKNELKENPKKGLKRK